MPFPASFSVISDEVSQDLAVVARFVREFGLSGFELRSMFGRAFKDLTDRDVAEIKAVVTGEGWQVHGCATPVFKCAIDDPAEIARHVDHFRRSLDVASALGCGLVRVFTFLRRPEPLRPGTIARIGGHLRELFALAAPHRIAVGIENESSCLIGTGEEVLALLPEIPAEGGGIIWDPCNVIYAEDDPRSPTRDFSRFAARVIHIHVKDARAVRGPNGERILEPLPVGEGQVGWAQHFAEIDRSGYRGLLSLETHWRVRPLDPNLLHLPAGDAFSHGGEEASRICLARIKELCAPGD